MVFRINHIHLKSEDPRASADWFVKALNFTILTDEERTAGDRFVRCQSDGEGVRVNFSNARTGETLGPAPSGVHYGMEHFGLDSTDMEADVARLTGLGATLEEGPKSGRGGQQVAFLRSPDGIRIELIQPAV